MCLGRRPLIVEPSRAWLGRQPVLSDPKLLVACASCAPTQFFSLYCITLSFGTYHVFWNTSWFWYPLWVLERPEFWDFAWPEVPLSKSKVANRMPIPYYFSSCFIRVGAKSWLGGFTQNWFWNLFWVLECPFASNLPGVLEHFMVLVPLVGSGTPWVLEQLK